MFTQQQPQESETTVKHEANLIFPLLKARARRQLLFALAVRSPQTADDLRDVGKGDCWGNGRELNRNSTIKNLNVMIKAGIVVQLEDPADGRRWGYALAPGVEFTTEGDRKVFDFGVVVSKISADGD